MLIMRECKNNAHALFPPTDSGWGGVSQGLNSAGLPHSLIKVTGVHAGTFCMLYWWDAPHFES